MFNYAQPLVVDLLLSENEDLKELDSDCEVCKLVKQLATCIVTEHVSTGFERQPVRNYVTENPCHIFTSITRQ